MCNIKQKRERWCSTRCTCDNRRSACVRVLPVCQLWISEHHLTYLRVSPSVLKTDWSEKPMHHSHGWGGCDVTSRDSGSVWRHVFLKAFALSDQRSLQDHTALFVALALLCGELIDPAQFTVAVFTADVTHHVSSRQHDSVLDFTVLQVHHLKYNTHTRIHNHLSQSHLDADYHPVFKLIQGVRTEALTDLQGGMTKDPLVLFVP